MKIMLTESKLKQIVAESVKRVLNEHYWDDMSFDEENYNKVVNQECDFYGKKEDIIRKLKYAITVNPNRENWDDTDYYAARILYNMEQNEKLYQDMDITEDDIIYLWRMNDEKRLKSIYYDETKKYDVRGYVKKDKNIPYYKTNHPSEDFPNHSYEFAYDGKTYFPFDDNDIEMDRNLNVYNNSYDGDAAIVAQGGDYDEKQIEAARNYGTTMRRSKENFIKNKK